jgi:hypothetical protein
MGRVSSTAASTLGSGVTTPNIQNISVTAATEETITIPADSRRLIIKMRDFSSFEVRYAPAAVDYYSVCIGQVYPESGLSPTGTYTFYITPNKTGTLEILSWS